MYKILSILILLSLGLSKTDWYQDSDEDGYTDRQEKHFGSDPLDDMSVIYKGNWPYNMFKSKIIDRDGFKGCGSLPLGNGCECTDDSQCMRGSKCGILFTSQNCIPKKGAQVPRLIAVDQYGDYFDLYDLSKQNCDKNGENCTPILIEISTMWNNPSNLLAAWLSNGNQKIYDMPWWQDNFENMKAVIDAGEVFYVRILHQAGIKGEVVMPEDAAIWHQAYPHLNIITLADPDAYMKTWIRPTGMPCVTMVNGEDMTIRMAAEGTHGEPQLRRGLKHAFEAAMFDNYMKTMHHQKEEE